MVTMAQAVDGIRRYIDSDILPHLSGARKFGVALYMELATDGAEEQLRRLVDNPAIKMLGVVDGDSIDIEKLARAINHQMTDGRLDIDLPVIGRVTFHPSDVSRLM